MNHFKNTLKYKAMISSKIEDSEAVVNLTNLFYQKKLKNSIGEIPDIIKHKTKYDNFKLLTDINILLQNCTHLTDKDRLMYCSSQRYFMKLYLREINKRE